MDTAESLLGSLRSTPIAQARSVDGRAFDQVSSLDASSVRLLAARASARSPRCFREAMVLICARLRIAAAAAVAAASPTADRGRDGNADPDAEEDTGRHARDSRPGEGPMEQTRSHNGSNGLGAQGSGTQDLGSFGDAERDGAPGGDASVSTGEKSSAAKSLIAEYVELLKHAPAEYVREVPTRWVATAREAVRLAVHTPASHRISHSLILPLRHVCQCLQADPASVLPLHADYLALCIHAKAYDAALYFDGPGVSKTRYDAQATCLSAADVLCKHYYLAVVYIALQCYAEALQQCRLALAVPSTTLCDIAVAVYRKYILVSLLHTGSPPAHLKVSSYSSGRLRSYATEYIDLSKAYCAAKVEEVHKLVASHAGTFEEDSNSGLVKLLVANIPRRAIMSLTTSFVTLSLDEVAVRAGLGDDAEEAKRLVVEMASAGDIRANVDAKKGIVRFSGEEEDDAREEGLTSLVSSVATSVWGPSAGGQLGTESKRCNPGRHSQGQALEASVDLALTYVERIQEFRNAILCDSAFVTRKVANEREFRSQGDVGLAMEEADHEID